jgi:hypothetical protein
VEIQSVGVLRCGIVLAILYGLFGAIEGIFLLGIAAITPDMPQGHGMPKIFSVGLAFMFPVFAVVAGFIGGVIGALLYNLVARWVGGIQLHLVPISEAEQKY